MKGKLNCLRHLQQVLTYNHKYYLLDISSNACGISDLLLEVYSFFSLLENIGKFLKSSTSFVLVKEREYH